MYRHVCTETGVKVKRIEDKIKILQNAFKNTQNAEHM